MNEFTPFPQKMISVAVPAFVKIADALIAECEKPQKQ